MGFGTPLASQSTPPFSGFWFYSTGAALGLPLCHVAGSFVWALLSAAIISCSCWQPEVIMHNLYRLVSFRGVSWRIQFSVIILSPVTIALSLNSILCLVWGCPMKSRFFFGKKTQFFNQAYELVTHQPRHSLPGASQLLRFYRPRQAAKPGGSLKSCWVTLFGWLGH